MPDDSKNVLQLTETISPAGTDIVYVAKRHQSGSFADRKASLTTTKSYVRTDKLTVKTGDYAIPIGQCDKRWFSNRDASTDVVFYLPVAEEGKEIGILLEASHKITIQPDSVDMIRPLSFIDGEAIESSTLGDNVYLRAYYDGWYIVSQEGTWII